MYLCGEKKIVPNRHENGQSMIESIICMFVILLLLFSFLELFNISLANMITNYASMSASRSASVGFKPYLVRRRAQCAAIPASGRRTYPDSLGWSYGNVDSSSMTGAVTYEKQLINQYIPGYMWIEYEYWNGENVNNGIYKENSTSLDINRTGLNATDVVGWQVGFEDYPSYSIMDLFFSGYDNFDITSEEAVEVNYASRFLDSN